MADASSLSSGPSTSSLSGSSARVTPVPNTYKPLTRSASVTALTKLTDEELRRQGTDELLRITRRLESENCNIISEHGTIMKDVNRRLQILMLEIRGLKDINQNLQDDNQELRDLCCFLDDDRQRGRKLAREWQRFGRYTASVMRSEVSAYQEKLQALESRQEELVSDNTELKELCLFLDQERLRSSQTRDEGDGSSSSTVAGGDEPQGQGDCIELIPVQQLQTQADSSTGWTQDYVRQLESQIRHLEEQKKHVLMEGNEAEAFTTIQTKPTDTQAGTGGQRVGPDGNQPRDGVHSTASPSKPEAVVHAMKVLQVHDQLERPHTTIGEENLDDKEKAIVREMCNVVWRKLGSVSAEQGPDKGSGASTPHPVYENIATGRDRISPPLPSPPPPTHHAPPPPSHALPPPSDAPAPASQAMPQPRPEVHQRLDPYQGPPLGHYDRAPSPSHQPPPTALPNRSRPPDTHAHRSVSNATQVQKPTPHHAQPPQYGYVRSSRSAPVTPVPRDTSQPPQSSSAAMPAHNYANIPRSEVQQPVPGPPLYTNHQQPQDTLSSREDHSYENVVVGQKYDGPQGERYYYTSSHSGPTPQPQGTVRHGYPSRPQQGYSSSSMPSLAAPSSHSQPAPQHPQGHYQSSQPSYSQQSAQRNQSQYYPASNATKNHQPSSERAPPLPRYGTDTAPVSSRPNQYPSQYSDGPQPNRNTAPSRHKAPPQGQSAPPLHHNAPSSGYNGPPPGHNAPSSGHNMPPSRHTAPPPGTKPGYDQYVDRQTMYDDGSDTHNHRYSVSSNKGNPDHYYGQNYK